MTLADTRNISDEYRQIMLANIVKATGLPMAAVEELYMTDGDLNELCGSVLSELAAHPKKVSDAEA